MNNVFYKIIVIRFIILYIQYLNYDGFEYKKKDISI